MIDTPPSTILASISPGGSRIRLPAKEVAIAPRFRSALAAPLLFLAATVHAEERWIEVRTTNFVVVANTGESIARDTGWQFEQVRHIFDTLWPWARRESGRPFVILVVKGDRDLRALAPFYWEAGRDGTVGVTIEGPGKDYVALKAGVALRDDLGNNPYFYAYWGYATLMLKSSFHGSLPLWYQRGLSDVFGNTIVRGKDVQVGRILNHHLRRLASGQRIPLAEVVATTRGSKKIHDDEGWRAMFDAEAWMFVHYLLFGDSGAHRPKLNRFADLLLAGRKPDEAFAEALGALAPLDKGFRHYLGRKLYQYARVELDLNVKKANFPVRPLPPAEAAAVRAGFHVAMGRTQEARALIAEARRFDAASLAADEAEAVLLDREGKDAEALAAYTRAAEARSQAFWVHYRRAALLPWSDPPPEVQEQRLRSLTEAVRLNPDHAWSQAALARVLTRMEPGERAIAAASRAVALEPRVVDHRLALIDALWRASRVVEAKKQADAALALPADAEDHASVQEWIAYLNSPDAASGPTPGAADSAETAEPSGTSGTRSGAAKDWIPAATRACEAGTLAACAALASALERGAGIPKDAPRALALYEKACSAELRACVAAAGMKIEGRGGPRDLAGARALAQRACDGAELTGCTTLAVAHFSDATREGVAKARTLLKQACDGGEGNACQLLKSMP